MTARRIAGVAAVCGAALSGAAADRPATQPAGVQRAMAMEAAHGNAPPLKYLLYLPGDYDKSPQRWPLVLFLHGAGERGQRLDLVKKHGPPKLVDRGRQFPFILVSPQCPAASWWTKETAALLALLNEVASRYRVDPNRVYVTGLSMGGMGTWALAAADPNRFAAIVPICGGGEPKTAGRIKRLPVWAFHGAKDRTVPLKATRDMIDALEKAGAKPRLTVYPEAGHDSWTATYSNEELYTWLLSQRRARRSTTQPKGK